ncbi:MAG: hypothetical protein IH845_05415 [Nanoarchaeota archaeon]|nr:hypothetical protein [Nanoarchaeota archaeon]
MRKELWFIFAILLILLLTLRGLFLLNYNNPIIEVKFSLSEINVENVSELSLVVKSSKDIKNTNGEIVLSEGIELVEGSLIWKRDLIKDKEEKISIKIKTETEGNYQILGFVGTSFVQSEIKVDSSLKSQLIQRFDSSQIIEYQEPKYEKRKRTWLIPMADGKIVPEPLKGKELNNYFKNLDITEENVYVMIQFEGDEGDPNPKWVRELERDGTFLFKWHGDHVYYARMPKNVLEEESYDFIRWIGIEDPILKLSEWIREVVEDNCTGELDINIVFYEDLNEEQSAQLSEIFERTMDGERVSIGGIEEIAKLGFVDKISPEVSPSLAVIRETDSGSNILENIICD